MVPGKYSGIPKNFLVLSALTTAAIVRWVKAVMLQYKFNPEGKNTTIGKLIKGTNRMYRIYFPKGLEDIGLFKFGFSEMFL